MIRRQQMSFCAPSGELISEIYGAFVQLFEALSEAGHIWLSFVKARRLVSPHHHVFHNLAVLHHRCQRSAVNGEPIR